ncbi:lipoyl(octanoyl) transferase LipB [Caldiplasma sukawensis]
MINLSTSSLLVDLKRTDYLQCLEFQRQLRVLRSEDKIPDTYIFTEHNPVYTIGRTGNPENYPGINPIRTERGGDVTYHGPGQIVLYPIIRIGTANKINVGEMINYILGIFEKTLSSMNYEVSRGQEPGLWINVNGVKRKVASFGMRIENGVTMHGVSLNYSSEVLEGFKKIKPCGLDPESMYFVNSSYEDLKANLEENIKKNYIKCDISDISNFTHFLNF